MELCLSLIFLCQIRNARNRNKKNNKIHVIHVEKDQPPGDGMKGKGGFNIFS